MKKITIIALSFLLFASGFSQAQKVKYPTRKGIVQEATMIMDKNGKPKKKPLAGVRIFTGEGVSNSSNAKGEFTLTPDAVPFKITQVKKNEYTLLSPEQGTRTYYDNNEILDILMVSTKTFNSRTNNNAKTATENNEKKKKESLSELEKRKDRGEITISEYIRMHDSITKVYSDRLQTLIKHCEESAKRWFMGQEIIDQEIDEAIIKGEFDKAVSLIESKGTTKQRTEEIEKSKAAYENHKKLAQQHDELAEKHKEIYESQVKSLVQDYRNRADIKLMEVKYDEVLTYLDSARVLQEEHFGLQDPDLATTYNDIGVIYLSQGKYEEALKWLDKALEIQEKVLDPLHPELATTYHNKGSVYWKQGKYEEAMKWIDKALEIREKVLDLLSPDLATSYNNKGGVYLNQGKYEEAMKWYDKALEIEEKVLDPLHPDLAKSYGSIGLAYKGMKNYEKALEYLEKALPGFIKHYGKNSEKVIWLEIEIKSLKLSIKYKN